MTTKPILFNTEMVRAILDGRKTQTRRVVKPQPRYPLKIMDEGYHKGEWHEYNESPMADRFCNRPWGPQYIAPYSPGDILWVRETFHKDAGRYMYRANYSDNEKFYRDGKEVSIKWRPSIHMPKEAARIFLRVENVQVERLHDMTANQAMDEGFADWNDAVRVWDSTIKKADLPMYGWNANPWVWVIEFERCEKTEGWCKS